ncbi:MAG: restriction endonuclease S subunit [Arenicella sp.]|jgi:restriction endonuclease S subunit
MKDILGEHILHLESGSQMLRSKGDQKVPVLTAANIGSEGQFVAGVYKRTDLKTVSRVKKMKLKAGDLIMVTDSSNYGRCLLIDDSITQLFEYISEHLYLIRPIKRVHPKYLWLKLNQSSTRAHLKNRSYGSSTPFITQSELKSIPIKIPDITTQEKSIRKNQLLVDATLLDNQARNLFRTIEIRLFEEIFGHPKTMNSSLYPIDLNTLCEFIKDGVKSRVNGERYGFPVLSSKDISPFEFQLRSASRVSKKLFKKFAERVLPENNDILIALTGKNRGHATLITSLTTKFSVTNVAVLRPRKELLSPSFLIHYLNHPYTQTQLREVHSRGSAIKYISLSKLRSLQIPKHDQDTVEAWKHHSNTLSQLRASMNNTSHILNAISEQTI